MSVNFFNFPGVALPLLQQILSQIGKLMTTEDDLNKAVADIQASDTAIKASDTAIQAAVATAVTLIQSLHSGAGTVTDAQVEAAVSSLETAAGDFSAAASDFSTASTNLAAAKPTS